VSHWVESFGLVALFAIIAVQAAGVPGPPGKTALIIASLLAAKGRMVLWQVLLVAALAVFVGGLVGYAIGRRGGRPLLERWWPDGKLARVLAGAEHFFERHGPKSVFVLRFLPGFKVAIGPAAGVARMPLVPFLLWHLLSAVAFALAFGLLGYFAGAAAVNAVERFGTYAAFGLAALALRHRGVLAPPAQRASFQRAIALGSAHGLPPAPSCVVEQGRAGARGRGNPHDGGRA
jgi:membrane protein DedA with SNARE-associated domain